jgi:DNA (cytosine-5)-methyltransferase 1
MTLAGQLRCVELFAGIGGFRIASDSLGLDTVFANDWDPHASRTYRSAHGTRNFHEGDIHTLIGQVPEHDLLTGGFPCQPFSYAGHKRGVDDARADTMSAICKLLSSRRPRAFVLENVRSLLTLKYGAHFKILLSRLAATGYSLEWRVLNAMDAGLPQNRKRILFVGAPSDAFPIYTLLGDELEWRRHRNEISECRDGDLDEWKGSFPAWGRLHHGHIQSSSHKRVLTAPATLRDWLDNIDDPRYDFTVNTLHRIKESTPIHQIIDHVEVLYNQEGGRRMGYTVFGINGVAPTLTCTTSRHYERFRFGDRYRRLTPMEYERLQGFPSDISACIPHSRRYIALGNAIPPGLAHIGIKAALKIMDARCHPSPKAA